MNRVEAYASARGVSNPACIWRESAPGYGYWLLMGGGIDRKGEPLVWRVADELKVRGSAGNADQIHISHPDRAIFPVGRWERELTTMLGDQDYPIQPEEAKKAQRVYSPSMLKQEKMLEELTGAMEVLPDVIESLTEYTVAQLEPYASRIILATVLLQTIEARLYAEHSDDDEDDDDTDLFEEADASEDDKDAAVMALAGKTGGNDGDE